tara:strand:+ start:2601 stop:3161 length:561 start_codon:yes stop_codon:yes gene_type:complete
MFPDFLSSQVGFTRETVSIILKALLLLLLSISGNFLAETLGCKTQFYLENMYVKHLLILFMIYFTIDFTQGNEVVNPIINIKRAFIVWILFHLFTHLDIGPTVIVLLMIMVLFFMSNYTVYLEKMGKKGSQLDKTIKKVEKVLYVLILSIIIIGFFYYYLEKRDEYGKRFNILKFVFGVKKCKSMK